MTTHTPHDLRELKYEEAVRLPVWGIGLLGLFLGVTAGVLTGVAIRNLVGDEPLIEGVEAGVFYVSFALAVVLDVFLLLNFTHLAVTVSSQGIEARFGVFAKPFMWSQVSGAEVADYSWKRYSGWGIRYTTGGRRAWSQIGAKRGVIVDVVERSSSRHYFISSKRPEELAAAINRGITANKQPGDEDAGEASKASIASSDNKAV